MSRNIENVKNEGVDRIEGDTIILHDLSPKKPRVLKKVKIITSGKESIRRIKTTRQGKYLMV